MSGTLYSSMEDCVDVNHRDPAEHRDVSIRVEQLVTTKRNLMEEKTEEIPLIQASENGSLSEVRYLVEVTGVDINEQGIFRTKHSRDRLIKIYGSALHAAVIAGKVEVVRYLVNCCKLDINAKTKALFKYDFIEGGSSALHLAVSHARNQIRNDTDKKEIITCLLKRGANWAIVNDEGYQFWELMMVKHDVELTKLLIQFGVGLDSSRHAQSSNIAHMWAKSSLRGSDEVIALVIDKGVDINEPDLNGLTPLMIAAIGENGSPKEKVVQAILTQNVHPVSRLDRIIALEIMGAALICKDKLEDGFKYMKMAMESRLNHETEPPIPKPPVALTDETIKIAFENSFEVQTIEELEKIEFNRNLLKEQANMIYLRILGLKHNETMRCLTSYITFVWNHIDAQTYFNYLPLILNGIESAKKGDWVYFYSKWIFFSLFLIKRSDDVLNNAMFLLRKLVDLLAMDMNSKSCANIDAIFIPIVNLTHLLLHEKILTLQQSSDLKCCLRRAVRLQKRNSKGFDLFLLSCSPIELFDNVQWPTGTSRPIYISLRRPISAKTISIFIEVGSDVGSVNNKGDTGLHILAKNIRCNECASSIRTLIDAGVQIDRTNSDGKTMADILRDRGIELDSLANSHSRRSILHLTAQMSFCPL